jgi:hypothetical protein
VKYEIIIPNPFGDGKIMVRLPLDIVGISRPDGEKFISVNGFNDTFDVQGEPYTPNQYDPNAL